MTIIMKYIYIYWENGHLITKGKKKNRFCYFSIRKKDEEIMHKVFKRLYSVSYCCFTFEYFFPEQGLEFSQNKKTSYRDVFFLFTGNSIINMAILNTIVWTDCMYIYKLTEYNLFFSLRTVITTINKKKQNKCQCVHWRNL